MFNENFATNNIFFFLFFFFSSWGAVEESTRRSWCNIDGTVCDVCDFKATITLSGVLRPIPVRVKRKSLTSGELPARREIIQLPALKKLKVGQNLLCCSLQNFKENQVPTWNNRIFGFLFMSWTFYCPPPPANAGFFNSSIVADVPYWEHIRGFFFSFFHPTGHS